MGVRIGDAYNKHIVNRSNVGKVLEGVTDGIDI
jgi:hypothetical protein